MPYASSSFVTGEGRLEIRCEIIIATSLVAPRKSWRFTDAAGHVHRWREGPDAYPTLTPVGDGLYWCEDCRDEHEDSHLECRWCGERITPEVTGPVTEQIPGMLEYYLDGKAITPEHAGEILARLRPQTGD